MMNIKIMKIMFVVCLVLNLFLPITDKGTLGISILFQWAIVLFHFLSLLNGIGYFSQKIYLLPVVIFRLLELAWYGFVSKSSLVMILFVLVIIVDLLYLALLFIDSSMYEYKRESRDEEESNTSTYWERY